MVHRITRLAVLSTTLMTVGCAAQQQAPFHVYQSPLLAAQTETPRPADRTFDPRAPGDFPAVDNERVVAKSGDGAWEKRPRNEAKEAKTKQNRDEKSPLPLSTKRSVGGHGGASSSSAEAGDLKPALAAAYVHKTLEVNGVSFPAQARTSIPRLWDACKSRGKTHQGDPLPGDAVFFHNAFDANADGRNNDWYTHVGVVETVGGDGTVVALSWRGGEVDRIHVNPKRPDQSEVDGETVNSRLRQPTSDDPPFTQYYAGQLFAGWCSVLGPKRDVVVIDSWRPESS